MHTLDDLEQDDFGDFCGYESSCGDQEADVDILDELMLGLSFDGGHQSKSSNRDKILDILSMY